MDPDHKKLSIALQNVTIEYPDLDEFSDKDQYDESRWRLSFLRSQFDFLDLNDLFKPYIEKISHGYFSLFLILEFFLNATHFLLLIISADNDTETLRILLPDLIVYFLLALYSLIGLFIVDRLVEKLTRWYYVSNFTFFLTFFSNFFVPIYHYAVEEVSYRPAYSTLIILCCYVFFNNYDHLVVTLLGFFISLCHLAVLYLITYIEAPMLWQRLLSDVIYLICINGLGIYFRYMNEIVKRRSFLDRREFFFSKFHLEHQKTQEDQLISSIIPNNIVDIVKENYSQIFTVELIQEKNIKFNPMDDKYLTTHDNVTILFADIVHYTEMTIQLEIVDLIETLNDLFSHFDDASGELQVTRIKFLGDCYYCVAGLPIDKTNEDTQQSNKEPLFNHAEACVELGLKMIGIIAKIRADRNLNINMRIGLHSGSVISGVIGSVKYQFDIWSKDVDLANKMETEGEAGKVHITEQTKNLLRKSYDIEETDKLETNQYFKDNNIKTYLVKPTENEQYTKKSLELVTKAPARPSLFLKRLPSGPISTTPTPGRNTIFLSELHGSVISQIPEEISQIPENAILPNVPRPSTNNGRSASLTSIGEQLEDNVIGLRRSTLTKRRMSANFPSTTSLKRNLRMSEERRFTAEEKRRTAFMRMNSKRYSEMTPCIEKEMKKSIEDMSFSKYKQFFTSSEISSLMVFKKLYKELDYLKISDPIFKSYLLCILVVIISVFLIQNVTSSSWSWDTWSFYATLGFVLFLQPLSWTEFIWNQFLSDYRQSTPNNKLYLFLSKTSRLITNNWIAKLIIYVMVCILLSYYVLSEMIECNDELNALSNKTSYRTNFFTLIQKQLQGEPHITSECFIPWHMSETCSLAILATFIFLRTMIWLKFISAAVITIIYAFCVTNFSSGFYKNSETTNFALVPQTAHIFTIVFLTFTLHLIDRQTDYMNRLDFLMNQNLLVNQVEEKKYQFINRKLLYNILPQHVAKIYLDVTRSSEDLYNEFHPDVAVMFASMIFDKVDEVSDKKLLLFANQYIHEFDSLTNNEEFSGRIEKIKLAKWTYMAASGLEPNGNETHTIRTKIQTLINFASEMMKVTKKLNNEVYAGFIQLRIGISHGPIVAGVVGSKKPLYDIWGDAVNMASRMDSTGVINRIHIMKHTAELVENLGYCCEFRGNIAVKGVKDHLVATYFVKMDESYNLIRNLED